MKSEYTASNCADYTSVGSDHLNSENIPLEGLDVNSFDFQIYWQPSCDDFLSGQAYVGGTQSLMKVNTGFSVDSAAGVLAHELGHNFGANHASCISDNNRGAVAWCDSDVTKASNACNVNAADWTEYCSPHSLMGSGGLTRPFYMDGKLTFDWADSVSHPALVSSIDWDSTTNKYTDCDPSCEFLLQRSDAATLENSASAVILLQTTHSSSNGNRYFVMEHRYDTPVLLIHWTDVNPNGRLTGQYGNTVLTDCNPETATWDDAGCSLGQHIELDTGDESDSIKVWVYVYSALENGKLKVAVGTGAAGVPRKLTSQPPIKIDITSDANPPQFSGSSSRTITNKDRDELGLSDDFVKQAVANQQNSRWPDDVFLVSPTPWDDLFRRYPTQETTMIMTPVKSSIVSKSSKPIILKSVNFDNKANIDATFSSSISTSVAETASSTFSSSTSFTAGVEVEVGIKALGGSATASMSFTSTSGRSVTEAKTVVVGSSDRVTVTLPPGGKAVAQLSSSQSIVKVRVEYDVRITGYVWTHWNPRHQGRYFWGYPDVFW